MTDYRPAHYRSTGTSRSRMSLLIFPLIAFLLGLAAMGWVLANWSAASDYLGITPRAAARVQATAPPPAIAEPLQSQPAEGAQTLLLDPEMQRRVAQLEQRITQIDDQSRAAVGNADRAEGLLVAFAARRALDRGVALGYIEGLLGDRFGETQRQAVATIITASRQPVTLEELQEGLKEVGPSLTGGSPRQDWWTAFKAELGGVVTVRKSGTPSTLPDERLNRATRRLEAGQVDVALAEVLRLPGRENARLWIANARRYVAARRALDSIETAALLEPRAQSLPAAIEGSPGPAMVPGAAPATEPGRPHS